MNWSQISKEIFSSLVIISHKEWDGGEDGMEEKGGESQTSVIDAICVDSQNISVLTVPIIAVPSVDKPLLGTQIISVLNFIAPTVSSMVTPASSASRPCLSTMTPSWMQPGTSPITRSMREIGAFEMELQNYEEGNITDVWDPAPFSSLLPTLPFHSLWKMMINNEGISSEI